MAASRIAHDMIERKLAAKSWIVNAEPSNHVSAHGDVAGALTAM
jgi:hypothetical protein